MVFSLEHDIKVTKNHQNLLPTQSVLLAHTVENDKIISSFEIYHPKTTNHSQSQDGNHTDNKAWLTILK
jgi:hypothetical protein